jgi:hypothetical protein
MEKNRSYRIPVEINAEVSSNKIMHEGIIENLSEEGLCMRITPTKTTKDFTTGIRLDLRFQLPSGETLMLFCKKRWSYRITPRSLIKRVGMEIIDPPVKYKDFVSALQ